MRIELASQTGHPVPQFVVHAESQVESMVLEAFVAYARQSERPVKFHLHGLTSTNGRPSSFNFGYAFDEVEDGPVAAVEAMRAKCEAIARQEAADWHERNADRYWQSCRIAGAIAKLRAPVAPATLFPPELLDRCADAYLQSTNGPVGLSVRFEDISAILRESGHAELVAALKLVRINCPLRPMDERMIDAALKRAEGRTGHPVAARTSLRQDTIAALTPNDQDEPAASVVDIPGDVAVTLGPMSTMTDQLNKMGLLLADVPQMFVLFVETSDQMDKSEPVGIYSSQERAEKAAARFKRYRTYTRGFAVDDVPATVSLMFGVTDGTGS